MSSTLNVLTQPSPYTVLTPDLIRYIVGFAADTNVTINVLRRVCKNLATVLSIRAVQNNGGLDCYDVENYYDYSIIGQRTRIIYCADETIGTPELKRIAEQCPYLTSLTLNWISHTIDISCIFSLLYITKLNLADIDINDEVIVEISKRLIHLTSLDISLCSNLTNVSINALTNSNLQLTDVNIEMLDFTEDAVYAFMSKFGPYLNVLNACRSRCSNAVFMKRIIPLCPNLEEYTGTYNIPYFNEDVGFGEDVDFDDDVDIDEDKYAEIYDEVNDAVSNNLYDMNNYWPNLKYLNFHGEQKYDYHRYCIYINIPKILHNWKLETLIIDDGYKISADSLVNIIESSPLLKNININSEVIGNFDIVLEALSKHCPLLEKIVISSCFTHYGWDIFVRGCTRLINVEIVKSIRLTDQNIEQLSLHCPKLIKLRITNTSLLTDIALRSLSKCKKLNTIILRDAFLITDVGIYELVSNCTKLTKIDIEHCQHVTPQVCETIAVHCKLLEYIRIIKGSIFDYHGNMPIESYRILLNNCVMLNRVDMHILKQDRECLVQLRLQFPNCNIR